MEYQPLHPAGFKDINENEISQIFVDQFINNDKRKYLVERFFVLLEKFKELGINAEVWIDGSFVTKKPEPGDIDIIFFLNGNEINILPNDKKMFLDYFTKNDIIKLRYHCDIYVVLNNDPNWRSYWRGWFGYTRNEEPKGIYRLYINAT
ncbi:MAG: hypothetical protein HZB41_02935 [Ignavibacteriae bacterium]|nr:hypothetical protein [Ignavibacteriota bacterium]